MKKLIASLLVLVFGATMVMAEVPEHISVSPVLTVVDGVKLNEQEFEGRNEISGQLLTDQEMKTIKGGSLPDMDGSVMYGSTSKPKVMNSDYIPTKSQVKSSINEIKKTAVVVADVVAAGVGLYAIKNPSVPKAVQYACGAYGLGRAVQQCSNF
ncbi:MAG: hypothetical protein AB1404_02805 [Spirochaetota bacterium]|uniref:Uncharacterized protein n=1 Tax=Gracilinema caldarium TaxID=215591 RepID=A0A7C3EED6_9SPIR